MLKFTIHSKELKNMMDKVVSAINKKSVIPMLRWINMNVDERGTLRFIGTNCEHWLEVRSESAFQTIPGAAAVSIDDIKVLQKLNGTITLKYDENSEDGSCMVQCGGRKVRIPCFQVEDAHKMPPLASENLVLTLKESWLMETLDKLSTFVWEDDRYKVFQAYNFNIKKKRVEAVNNACIGMRTIDESMISYGENATLEDVLLNSMCYPVMKKVLDKKSDADLKVYQDGKFIRIDCGNFTYIVKRIEGEFYNVDRMMSSVCCENYFVPDRVNILEALKYIHDLAIDSRPVMFYVTDGKLYAYYNNGKYESFEELNAEIHIEDGFCISFNPRYLLNVFSVIDLENPDCKVSGTMNPMLIDGNGYNFLVLPVRDKGDTKEKMLKILKFGR